MGYRIREVRESLGMSQEELAQKSGVSRVTISALESGRDKVTTTTTLLRIAKALNITVDNIFLKYMFGQINTMQPRKEPHMKREFPQELLDAIRTLKDACASHCYDCANCPLCASDGFNCVLALEPQCWPEEQGDA